MLMSVFKKELTADQLPYRYGPETAHELDLNKQEKARALSLLSNDSVEFYIIKNKFHPAKLTLVNKPWNVCAVNKGETVDALIIVHTRTGSFELREFIRRTWANRTLFPTVNVAFVIGRSASDNINSEIDNEAARHGDIMQGNFTDTYLNLPFKPLAWLPWINNNCLNAKLLIKVDDDVVVNTRRVLDFVKTNRLNHQERSFTCDMLKESRIDRDPHSPYFISFDEHEADQELYDPYCNGAAMLISNDLIPLLNNLTYTTSSTRFDDVYLGMLAKRIGHGTETTVKFVDSTGLMCKNCNELLHMFKDVSPYLFILNVKKIEDHESMWRRLQT
jgi:hypothetical protein